MAKPPANFKPVYDWDINETLFHETTVGDVIAGHLISGKDCIMIEGECTVEKALEIMVMRGISSLPIRNKDNQFAGILSMADIVAHVSGYSASDTAAAPPADTTSTTTTASSSSSERPLDPALKGKDALNFPCYQLLGLTWESRNVIVFDVADRLDLVFSKLASTGAHRALVQAKSWWQVISQWDLAVWLARHCAEMDDPNLASFKREWLGTITNASLDELNMIESKQVVCIPHSMSAMEGFRQLARYGVSAMPITAENGTLCGTLSNSDLRGMDHTKLKALSLPVMEFLKVSNLLQFPQVVANGRMKFGDILIRIRARDVHRVWIISGDNKPIGVLSLTDIIHKLHQFLTLTLPRLGAPGATAGGLTSSAGTKFTGEAAAGAPPAALGGCSYGNTACNCGPSCACHKGGDSCEHEHMKGLPQPSSGVSEKLRQQQLASGQKLPGAPVAGQTASPATL